MSGKIHTSKSSPILLSFFFNFISELERSLTVGWLEGKYKDLSSAHATHVKTAGW